MSEMPGMPGGAMASRPVHFIWLLDCSGSMSVNGKIGQLNFAVREAIPAMRQAAGDNAAARLMVRALTFSTGAQWHLQEPTAVEDFSWSDVGAEGVTDLGSALRLVAKELETPPMESRALRPVLALVSDGQPTDDWRDGLRAVDATPWGKRAVRAAIAVGVDADRPVLQEFLGNPELTVLDANTPKQLAAAIRWTSTVAVKAASTPKTDISNAPTLTAAYIPPVDSDDGDVW